MSMVRTLRLAGATLVAAAFLPSGAALGAVHTVAPGETLWGIAMANRMATATVAAANGLSPEARVIAGTRLIIPTGTTTAASGTTTAAAPASGSGIRVAWGDTLSGLAVRHGVSMTRLAAVNSLDPARPLLAGTRLTLPAAGGAGTSASASAVSTSSGSSAPEAMGGYTVRVGDTLSGLAARSRIGLAQMAYMNGLDPDKPLLAGTVLKLPTGSPLAASSSSATPQPVAASSAPQAAPAPSPGRLSAGQIQSIAAQHGAPSSLATAIAWQESGFNNGMLSSANARGIMQVMPGTWDWVQRNLSSSRRLDPDSPEDNVRAGSLYLASLLRETNGDPAMAAAAYYQGLSSVRRIGMLPETRRYVANVLALRSRFGG
jgi:N-acetylmuramoyl-L-alanine amidase